MIQGLYSAANGMIAVEDRQAVIANNIANAATPGFKSQLAVQRGYKVESFGALTNPRRFDLEKAPGGGIKVTETFSNYSNGMVTDTGNPLDMALIGPGFFQIDTAEGVQYTRSGRFSIGETGLLVTGNGENVLDIDGEPIDISDGFAKVDPAGNVYVDDVLTAQLGIIEFDDPHALMRAGFTMFRASEEVVGLSRLAEVTTVAPAALEGSNVSIPLEITNMLMAVRAYAANQQVLASVSETTQRLIDQVGGQG